MSSTRVILDADFTLAPLDRRVFGSFVEHMGRCVYTGIFEPGHPQADAHGFRRDVLELVRELGPTIIRYPGGNFLSGYHWEDGIGPVENRPRRLDLAWLSTETNRFGVNEFIQWCREANVEPMLGVNLGTRGPDEARHLLEYCNHPRGSYYSDLRHQHGFPEPHNVKFWCLGNEMDGPWQICHKTSLEYGRTAEETAKVMRWTDPSVELAACGSSHRQMPFFGTWEYEVLQATFEHVDFLSLHMYYQNPLNDVLEFLGNIDVMDSFIREAAAVADAVAAKYRSNKRIKLSFDEWNVWYKARETKDMEPPGWPEAPRLIEEVYDVQDALMVGGALITLINNADRVKAACLAQLVNVIGPIKTEPGGPAWRQTIFYPFQLASRFGHGTVLQAKVLTETFETKTGGLSERVLAAPVHDPNNRRLTLFVLNRGTDGPAEVNLDLRGFPSLASGSAFQIHGPDLLATNSAEKSDHAKPVESKDISIANDRVTSHLPPLSWNVLVLNY
jgi:alpha-N-arabinofuranosidase